MATLKSRLRSELEDWYERLPKAWKPYFDDVELGFDNVDAGTTLRSNEKIWPQETNVDRPPRAHVFKAFRDLAPDKVRVVIFGNDPYTRLEQATGRSFEQGNLTNWKKDIQNPKSGFSPSLMTVIAAALATNKAGATYPLVDGRVVFNPAQFKYKPDDKWGPWNYGRSPLWISHLALELCLRHEAVSPPSPKQIFDHWAQQGVFWVNRALTFTKWETNINKPGHRRSHQKVWEPFTSRVIDTLIGEASSRHRIVFALWGSEAKELGDVIRKRAKGKSGIAFVETGHPQRPENYFVRKDKLINPLDEINKAIQGKPIEWT